MAKNKFFTGLFFIPVIFTLSLTGCSVTTLASHYVAGSVSFDYPTGWQVSTPSTPNSIAAITDSQNTSVTVLIQKRQAASGSTLQQAHESLVNSLSPTSIVTATASCAVGGGPAYETYFLNGGNEFRVTSLLKDGTLYSVTSSGPKDAFIKNQTNFDIVVNSLKLQ
jgi:hypothetical protein